MSVFDAVAELYDRARPTYPDELVDAIVALGPRILEIGPGTGQATRALAARGAEVTAVELGPRLAALAQRNAPSAHVVVADFDTWEPERADFDAVTALTAFHWLDPATKYAKVARLLRPGGALAVVEAVHVRVPGGDAFWEDVQEDYDAVAPSPDNVPPPLIDEVGDLCGEFERSGCFADVDVRRFDWELVYTGDEYVDLLSTYSPNIRLDPATATELLRRIRERIGGRTVTKHQLATLTLGRVP